ncbi:hypothetical protein ZWY2020_035573 [Hordeum vulgare]|nr:hypothetical protein ZWY2020_035573 [Hordeum vulgare]
MDKAGGVSLSVSEEGLHPHARAPVSLQLPRLAISRPHSEPNQTKPNRRRTPTNQITPHASPHPTPPLPSPPPLSTAAAAAAGSARPPSLPPSSPPPPPPLPRELVGDRVEEYLQRSHL